ncbi:LacI family DNA-binding transcriptional regulator [Pelagicoccus enzymogenes]|uniref:LacI family DNA-binding transcriptional regulator n=1 Tax=Pelagicoccus enzymogenes TaxID=2773457 RepID=UPI00280C85E5|nr:LacI family DNA-binding transcriptional regulator [Pelagicoccus enzymogenes]MDQ8198157.1 LacI family DNA-binding transcriptional regulator [Pelagicoccus enzymogenes]
MDRGRVTLQQIADRDGTHVTTVSLALRNSPKLNDATRARIQKLADEMGYVPDPALNALVAYRRGSKAKPNSETLAYITNWTSRLGWQEHPAHAQFFEGATAAAESMGYRLEHFWLSEPHLSHQRLSKILEHRGIRGLIVASHSRQMEAELKLDWPNFSGVKIDFFPHEPQLSGVTNNQIQVARLAVRKALESGARRIGLVMHRGWDMSVDRRWTAGFLVEQALLPEADRIPICYFPEETPRSAWENETESEVRISPDAFRSWYQRWKPEVIIGCHSFLADALPSCKLSIPQHFSLIDLFLYEENPSFAGLLQNHRQVGTAAVELLAGQLVRNSFGIPDIPTLTLVEANWSEGASLADFSSSAPARP